MQQSKQLETNSTQALAGRATEIVRQAQHSQWREENKQALEAYNRRIEARGTFSDGLRRF